MLGQSAFSKLHSWVSGGGHPLRETSFGVAEEFRAMHRGSRPLVKTRQKIGVAAALRKKRFCSFPRIIARSEQHEPTPPTRQPSWEKAALCNRYAFASRRGLYQIT